MAAQKRKTVKPTGGGGGGPIGGGSNSRLILQALAKKFKEISVLYERLSRTPIGGVKPHAGGGTAPTAS
jgi:hypothetical protein